MNDRLRLAGRLAIVATGSLAWLILAAIVATVTAYWTTAWTGSQSGGAAFSTIANEVLFLVAAFALSRKLETPPIAGDPVRALGWGLAGALVILPLNGGLSWLCERAGFPPQLPPEYLPHARYEILVWVLALPLVAIGEEWLFRHALPALFRLAGGGERVAIAGSALLFGVIHLGQGWIAIPLAALLALPFFYLKKKSGGLAAPMLAHLLVDTVAVFLMTAHPNH